jgi:hypothetical protein
MRLGRIITTEDVRALRPATASHAIGFAEPGHAIHSPGFGTCEDDAGNA